MKLTLPPQPARGARPDPFVAGQFRAAGLAPLAGKVVAGENLSPDEAEPLLRARLPLLAKLVELKSAVFRGPATFAFDNVVACPLATLLESHPPATAIAMAQAMITLPVSAALPAGARLHVALDRWQGRFTRQEFFAALAHVLAIKDAAHSLVCLGPAASDLHAWLSDHSFRRQTPRVGGCQDDTQGSITVILSAAKDLRGPGQILRCAQDDIRMATGIDSSIPGDGLAGLVAELRAAGVHSFYASQAGPTERAAAEAGLAVTVAHTVHCPETMVAALAATRETLAPTSHLAAWCAEPGAVLDQSELGEGEASGGEVLRAVALARLLLPDEVQIRAPLAFLGPKVAHAAWHFGATHLGLVAADGSSPVGRLVATREALLELTSNQS